MEKNIPVKKQWPAWLWFVLSLGMSALAGYLLSPMLFFAPAFFMPALFVYTMKRSRAVYLIPLLLPYALVCMTVYGTASLPFYGAVLLLPTLVMYLMYKKPFCNSYATAATAAATVAALYIAVCLPDMLSGAGAFASQKAFLREYAAAFEEVFAPYTLMEGYEGSQAEQFYESALALTNGIIKDTAATVVPILCGLGVAGGLTNVLFLRLFARSGDVGLPPMRRFSQWEIPRVFHTGIIVLLLGALIFRMTGAANATAVSNTVNVLFGIPLIVQGLAVVQWLIEHGGPKMRRLRWPIYIAVVLLIGMIYMPLMMVGCLDMILHIRARRTQPPQKTA